MKQDLAFTDDHFHATIACTGMLGSPVPKTNSASVPKTEGSGSSGVTPPKVPRAGAAARSFNLDACFTMVEPLGEG